MDASRLKTGSLLIHGTKDELKKSTTSIKTGVKTNIPFRKIGLSCNHQISIKSLTVFKKENFHSTPLNGECTQVAFKKRKYISGEMPIRTGDQDGEDGRTGHQKNTKKKTAEESMTETCSSPDNNRFLSVKFS
ncbi:hypothetical protein ACOMHN_023697 [Nucella lapillus]